MAKGGYCEAFEMGIVDSDLSISRDGLMIYLKGKKWITKQHTHTGPISHYRCVSMFDNTHTPMKRNSPGERD